MPAVARPSATPLPGAPCIPSVLGVLILSAGLLPQGALAQSATPGATEEIVVIAPRSPVVARLDAAPGATAILSAEAMPASANLTISRALADVPGVVVQDFFGGNDQPRIQMRGSGLQQNPVERGVLMLRNGLPLNRADGSYIVGFANPGEAEAIEVYRGYMANRLGATVLGGALNLISPTGRSAPGDKVTASAGSFDKLGGGVQRGFAGDGVDVLIRGDITRRDGYRDYNESRRAGVGGNVGLRLSETLTVRVFASYADLGFDVSGPLTRELLESDPRPLVVMTPKSLLRHPRAGSRHRDLTDGQFQMVIDDPVASERPKSVRRVVLCSGKVYVDLTNAEHENAEEVAVVRVELLHPFPAEQVRAVLERYASATEIVWLQEEPQNMGPWQYMYGKLNGLFQEMGSKATLSYIGRPEQASPAEGSADAHAEEQARIVQAAWTMAKKKAVASR